MGIGSDTDLMSSSRSVSLNQVISKPTTFEGEKPPYREREMGSILDTDYIEFGAFMDDI